MEKSVAMGEDTILEMALGCRLHATQDVLLVPEGTLSLSGPSREILTRLDGTRSVSAVIDDLVKEYPGADREEIGKDVVALLERLEQRGVLRRQ